MLPAPDPLALFEQHRSRLFGIAYRMLGTVDDAHDLVQETFLRWHDAEPSAIRAPESWLVAVITRLAIDRLRSAAYQRERYVGTWLPEPILSEAAPTDRAAELASDLSMALLVLLERLAPEERAAFLLRDVLDVGYDEIARVLEKNQAACRQMVHRARARVREDRPRFPVSREVTGRLVERFLAALATEDSDELLAVVASDATWISDGGGKVSAARNVVHGASHIMRMVLGIERKWGHLMRHELVSINGEPGITTWHGDQLYCTTSIESDGERITAFYRVLNPDKLPGAPRQEAP